MYHVLPALYLVYITLLGDAVRSCRVPMKFQNVQSIICLVEFIGEQVGERTSPLPQGEIHPSMSTLSGHPVEVHAERKKKNNTAHTQYNNNVGRTALIMPSWPTNNVRTPGEPCANINRTTTPPVMSDPQTGMNRHSSIHPSAHVRHTHTTASGLFTGELLHGTHRSTIAARSTLTFCSLICRRLRACDGGDPPYHMVSYYYFLFSPAAGFVWMAGGEAGGGGGGIFAPTRAATPHSLLRVE